MRSFNILLPVLLMLSSAMGHTYIDVSDLDHHPMILEAEESIVECPATIDPEAYWMKKFLNLVKDELPHTPVTWDQLVPNLRHLADLEQKGWLAAIAKGEKKASDVVWPDEALKPFIISGFMPVVTPPQPEPVIILEQEYDDIKVFREVVGNVEAEGRKKRDVNGEEVEDENQSRYKRRAYRVNPDHSSEDLPYIGEKQEHEIHEPEFDDNGQIIGRKKRHIPENMVIWPNPGTLYAVKRVCVKADDSGDILFPIEG